MWKVINAVAVTLLVALVCVVPAAIVARYIPDLIDPGLQPVAIAAWAAGLISWWLGGTMVRNQIAAAQQAAQGRSTSGSHAKAIGMTVGFLALALGAAAALHIFGDGLL
jgi:putative Mn2+ efflux pump MntP